MDFSPLNRLSNEVLHLIIDVLSSRDCRNLRLTCHLLSTLALSRAFSDIHIKVTDFVSRPFENEEGFPELVTKYGPLVKALTVDGRDLSGWGESISPLEVHDYLPELPNLRTLCLHGDSPEYGYYGYTNHFDKAYALLKQATLLTRPEERTFQHLRTLRVDVYSLMGTLWALPFIMDGLETLHMSNFSLDKRDPISLPTKFHRKTNLKTLIIDSSYIHVGALTKLLAFPRALAYLELDHRSDEWDEGDEEDPWTPAGVYAAIMPQRTSLEVLKLRSTDESLFEEWEARFAGRMEEFVPHPHVYEETGGVFDLSKGAFPKLRVYDGFYLDSSGTFVPEKR